MSKLLLLNAGGSGVGKPILSNIAAYYRFDNSLVDSSGNNRNLTGTVNYGSPGKLGSNYLNTGGPTVPFTAVTTHFSVASWIRFASTSAAAFGNIGVYDNNASNYVFNISAQRNTLVISLFADNVVAVQTSALSTNTWYYAVGTYDGVNAHLYLDGSLVGSAAGTVTPANITHIRPAAANVRVNVDESALWVGRVLSLTDVQELYNSGNGYDPTL